MRYTKEQLIKNSKPYFERNKALNCIFATEDGQFFYSESRGYALKHAANMNIKYYIIAREDVMFKPKQKELSKLKDTEEKIIRKKRKI